MSPHPNLILASLPGDGVGAWGEGLGGSMGGRGWVEHGREGLGGAWEGGAWVGAWEGGAGWSMGGRSLGGSMGGRGWVGARGVDLGGEVFSKSVHQLWVSYCLSDSILYLFG